MTRFPAVLAASAAALISASTQAQEQQRTAVWGATGIEYSSGKYGAEDKTNVLIAPAHLRASTGGFTFSASLPYLRIDSPGTVVGGWGVGPIILDPGTPARRAVRSGIGDLTLGASYALPSDALGGFNVAFGTQVKLPTASAKKSLGTGKTDVAVNAEVSRAFGRVVPFTVVSYRMLGDTADYELRNGFAVSAGSGFQLTDTTRATLSYDYIRAASPLAESSKAISGGLTGAFSERTTWTLYGNAGLSEGAPDAGVGLQIGFKLN